LDRLEANGSTAMSSGLQLAYDMAYEQLDDDSVTRVIVLSDGDANVGASSHEEILRQIGDRAREGVTLSTIGFGMGNYKDTTMEQLANKGDGNYYYIDTLEQAEKVFEEDLLGTLFVIAKDVKIQVEFDPKEVESYRLVGYENRDVADKDFRNDAVDAGEIGAGHRVTALYEVKLRSGASAPATVRIRHKAPTGGKATETTYSFSSRKLRSDFDESSPDFRLAVAAMSFAEILRGSPHAKGWSLREVRQIANRVADDEDSQELVDLIDRALQLGDEPRASR
jgi:Ca-activated chloride channel family protein